MKCHQTPPHCTGGGVRGLHVIWTVWTSTLLLLPAAPGALSPLETAPASLPDTKEKRSESVSAFLSCTSFTPPTFSPSTLSCNPLPTQAAVKVRQFYTVRLQYPCPISLWSELGLNMPILILPNKLNHAVGAQRWGRALRGGGCSCQTGSAALCLLQSRRPGRRIINWIRVEESTGGRRRCCCWP